ncbi:hypothetical protein ABE571_03900 [Stenotrophomonas sp. TWI273]|jgi:hypothetical protein|uniref:hypothetical protein n=1 Tax=unclassified Stenotrophomonas TaxID=196198 RepID=UPI000E90ED2E|nr:hypothetical protein [Stenotrophomonas sp.]HAU81978.1 hypothetical protein [Stenotrophomonas sp.]
MSGGTGTSAATHLTDEQRQILRDINATRPVSDEAANWAVKAGYAAQAEDGDIDLTQAGRQRVDSSTL